MLSRGDDSRPALLLLAEDDDQGVVALFDLTDAERGTWDLVLTLPDGPLQVDDALSVVAGTEPTVVPSLSSRTRVRVDTPTRAEVLITNTGNVDAVMVPVFIELDDGFTFTLDAEILEPDTPNLDPEADDLGPWRDDDGQAGSFLVPRVPAGGVARLSGTLTGNDLTRGAFRVQTLPPMGGSISGGPPAASGGDGGACLGRLGAAAASSLGVFPALHCIESGLVGLGWTALDSAGPVVLGSRNGGQNAVISVENALVDAVLSCAGAALGVGMPVSAVLAIRDITKAILTCSGDRGAAIARWIDSLTSVDPNEIVGPVGGGEERWIRGDGPLDYSILFENLPGARLPAREVLISSWLDPTLFDLDALVFQQVTVADLSVPVDGATFEASLPSPFTGIDVRVVGWVDPTTGDLRVTLSAVDPTTGLPPADDLDGFLPPNATGPEGEGAIAFRVPLREGLAEGTTIGLEADIVFDTNDPIATGLWTNRLDLGAPTASLDDGPDEVPPGELLLPWTGSDGDGGGVETVALWVGVDGDEPELLDPDFTDDGIAVEVGRTYRLFVEAFDVVGRAQVGGVVERAVRVTEDASGDCGCRTSPGGWAWVLVLLGLTRRRVPGTHP